MNGKKLAGKDEPPIYITDLIAKGRAPKDDDVIRETNFEYFYKGYSKLAYYYKLIDDELITSARERINQEKCASDFKFMDECIKKKKWKRLDPKKNNGHECVYFDGDREVYEPFFYKDYKQEMRRTNGALPSYLRSHS